ncbi:E2 domain-containing protein [Salinarimonas sp. NSM]|uniref:E2 domain-containing protein n=1 Tax=Salinarimonas sp. NSM TaxID=3458003 RepID=UPI004036ED99
MTSFAHLASARPGWFGVRSSAAPRLAGLASLDDDISAVVHGFELSIEADASVQVRETIPGTRLPTYCPERHINSDASFCLGMGMTSAITSREQAEIWWTSLRQFLELQVVVGQTGIWPKAIELDHGEAGGHHRRALQAAAILGVEAEYEAARLGERSWITDGSVRVSRKCIRLLNGRAACPLGCQYRGGHPKLRRNCAHSTTIAELVDAERRRRKGLDQFWQLQKTLGLQCCRSVSTCPLNCARQPARGATVAVRST